MDITFHLLYYYKRLDSDAYISHVWDVLTSKTGGSCEDVDATDRYDDHLPIYLERFFHECTTLLQATHAPLDYNKVPKRYILSLVYTGLEKTDEVEEGSSVPLQASLFFVTLLKTSPDEWGRIEQCVITSVFNKALALWDQRITRRRFLSFEVVNSLRLLVKSVAFDMTLYSIKLICMLARNIANHTRNINFMSDEITEVDEATFGIYKLFLESYQLEHYKTEITVPILLKLLEFLSGESPIARGNALTFHQQLVHLITMPPWYCNVMVTMLTRYSTQNILLLLDHVEWDKYHSIFRMVMNTFIKATAEEEIVEKLEILSHFIDYCHPRSTEEHSESIIRRIINESFIRFAHESYDVVEKVMSMYIKCLKMRDIYVKRVMQRLITTQNENICGSTMFELLLVKCDLQWKRIKFNVQFIELLCLMFLANRSFVSSRRVKVIEGLCVKAAGSFLKDCLPVFIEIITTYPNKNQQLVKSVLSIMVHFALSSGGICERYIHAIFNLISPIFDPSEDNFVAFSICNILVSDDFDCVGLFKAMELLKLIGREHLEILFEHRTLKTPISWKLLVVLLDVINYDEFPNYMQYYYVKFVAVQFYETNESFYALQVISKIFSFKLRHDTITPNDTCLANLLEDAFRAIVTALRVPIKHIHDVVLLLLILERVTGQNTEWMRDIFDRCKQYVSSNFQGSGSGLTSAAVYMGVLIQHVNVEFSNEDVDVFEQYITNAHSDITRGNKLLSSLIFFYGKYVLKQPQITDQQILRLKLALTHPCPLVKQTSMVILYDICNLRLNYYNAVDEQLIATLKSNDVEVTNSALRILMKLIAEDQLRLSADHYVKVFSVLFDRNLTKYLFHKDSIERQFIQQNEALTVKYFIHLIMFFNNYKEHILFQLETDTTPHIEFTQVKKNVIFKMTYGNMQRRNQLHILTIVTRDILGNIYSGTMPLSKCGYNVFHDVLMLVILTAMEYTNETIDDVNKFHRKLLSNIKRDFFSAKRQLEVLELDLVKVVEELMKILLKILYKTERINMDIMLNLFSIIAFCTNAFYHQLLCIVADNKSLQNLYYELPNFYCKHKAQIETNPINLTEKLVKDEWNVYLKDL